MKRLPGGSRTGSAQALGAARLNHLCGCARGESHRICRRLGRPKAVVLCYFRSQDRRQTLRFYRPMLSLG